jgi:phosphonate transport system ATP-binding protein
VIARSQPLLRLADLAVAPPAAPAPILRDVDLVIEPGECVALVGPSGAGKTTLLRTISRQLEPRAGTIVLDGCNITVLRGRALRAVRHQIGYVAQKHDLVEPLRVDQNVMAGALGRWSAARALRYLFWPAKSELAEARDALAAVGLTHKLRAPTTALSGGEQQRVAIARALVQSPKLLLADEPVASLDPATARVILELLTRLAAARQMALLCSLHQPELAQRYFDRIVEVAGGTIVCRDHAPVRGSPRAAAHANALPTDRERESAAECPLVISSPLS